MRYAQFLHGARMFGALMGEQLENALLAAQWEIRALDLRAPLPLLQLSVLQSCLGCIAGVLQRTLLQKGPAARLARESGAHSLAELKVRLLFRRDARALITDARLLNYLQFDALELRRFEFLTALFTRTVALSAVVQQSHVAPLQKSAAQRWRSTLVTPDAPDADTSAKTAATTATAATARRFAAGRMELSQAARRLQEHCEAAARGGSVAAAHAATCSDEAQHTKLLEAVELLEEAAQAFAGGLPVEVAAAQR